MEEPLLGSEWDPSRPLPHPGHEKYAAARASGVRVTAAARECNIHRGTASRWERDLAVQARRRFLVDQDRADEHKEKSGTYREITINRNDIIMGLADIAQDPGAPARARVAAFVALADIFLIRPRNIEELRRGIGWTEEEHEYFQITKLVPPRISVLTGAVSVEDLIDNGKPRKKNKLTKSA